MGRGVLRALACAAAWLCALCLCGCGAARAQGELVGEAEGRGISVRVERYTVGVTQCYVARVRIEDAAQLRTEPAYAFDREQTADAGSMARRVGAVLAINGDYYSYQSGGYMIRGGTLYRDQPLEGRDVLLIDENGDFYIERAATRQKLERYADMDIVDSFNFGPGLVVDGEVISGYSGRFNASRKPRQRSCIAQVERGRLEYLCVSCEGPMESDGGGLTIEQFAEFVAGLGVQNAYNLDGGDSTALILRGEKLNAPNNRKHRAISDIICFLEAEEAE